MSFESEYEAVNVLEKNFNLSCFNLEKIISAREFSIGFGIADLVYFELSNNLETETNTPIISDSAIAILKFFRNDILFTAEQISELAFVSIRTAKKKLKELVEAGYLEFKNKVYTLKRAYRPIVEKVIAIEVKLYNWKKALSQAFKYMVFANQSYVAMDADFVHRAKANISEFQKCNIGLLSITSEGDIKKIWEPTWEPTHKDLPFWKLNERVRSFI